VTTQLRAVTRHISKTRALKFLFVPSFFLLVVILSQLQAFVGELTVANVLIPIVSAVGFLVIGGYIAIFVLPKILDRCLLSRIPDDGSKSREWVSLAILFSLLLGLIPATYYAKASPLMGAFLAGLVFCSFHSVHAMFASQFKRVMQWLLRIFFAASIGKCRRAILEVNSNCAVSAHSMDFSQQDSRCRFTTLVVAESSSRDYALRLPCLEKSLLALLLQIIPSSNASRVITCVTVSLRDSAWQRRENSLFSWQSLRCQMT